MSEPILRVHTPDGVERDVRLAGSETLIGRAPGCHLQISDESASREHAVVLSEAGRYSLEDLQSTNGVRVNGKRVRSAQLSPGDEIEIGQTRIVFSFR